MPSAALPSAAVPGAAVIPAMILIGPGLLPSPAPALLLAPVARRSAFCHGPDARWQRLHSLFPAAPQKACRQGPFSSTYPGGSQASWKLLHECPYFHRHIARHISASASSRTGLRTCIPSVALKSSLDRSVSRCRVTVVCQGVLINQILAIETKLETGVSRRRPRTAV